MKKTTVILICILLIAGFAGLVFYGLRHSRGIPVVMEKKERPVLEAPFIDKEIDLSQGISFELWDSLTGKEIKLMHQLMVLPWPKSLIEQITIKAFHNKGDIYFYISWKDETEDRKVANNEFSDACAILFPLADEVQPPTIMMGFLGKANIWQWKGSQDREYWLKESIEDKAYVDFYYPFEDEEVLTISKDVPKSAANDLIAIRAGTVTPKQLQYIQGRGIWRNGVWQVVLKRSLEAVDPELDAMFKLNTKRLCGFAVWNGFAGDRGGRKSISDWVELEVK